MPPHRLYVPLRGNAHTLVAGAPGNAFRRRLKVASLLFDDVVLDEGNWIGMSGPRGAIEMRGPDPYPPGFEGRTWQPGAERHHEGRPFHFLAEDDQGRWQQIGGGPTSILWWASFEPIRQELPAGSDWMHFAYLDLPPEDKSLVAQMSREAVRDGVLKTALPDDFTRNLVAKNANFGLVLGSRMGMGIALDGLHSTAVAARIAHGDYQPLHGADALVAVIPDARNLSWEQINEARRMGGLPRLRAILGEVEQHALASGEPLDEAALREFLAQYARANEQTESVPRSVLRSALIATVISGVTLPITGPFALVVEVGATIAIEGAAAVRRSRRRKNSWTTAADRLREMAEAAADTTEANES